VPEKKSHVISAALKLSSTYWPMSETAVLIELNALKRPACRFPLHVPLEAPAAIL
jgi:hypothetical protein